MSDLLKVRGFAAYLLIAFLNAATDIGHKIIIQNIVFVHFDGSTQIVLTAIVNALILVPFVLLFTPSGYLADKFPKDRVIRIAAAISIPIAVLITVCYYAGRFEEAFALTLFLSIQSAFYSPAKYGYIRELVGKELLAPANSYVQAVTIVAILASTFLFSLLFEHLIDIQAHTLSGILRSIAPVGYLLIAFCALETLVSFRLERKREKDTAMRFDVKRYATFGYLRSNLRAIRNTEAVWLSIIGLSLFWGINQVVLAAFPEYLKNTAGVHSTVVASGMMALGGLGIIVGSIAAGRVSRHFIETGIIPLGAIGMTASLFLLPSVSNLVVLGTLFFGYGVMGGLFIVPLNALIQFHAGNDEAGTVLAGNNFVQNVVMLLFLGITVAVLGVDGFALLPTSATGTDVIYGLAIVALTGTIYTFAKLPQSFLRYIVSLLLSQRYRLAVEGIKNIPSSGGVLLLGNHTSFLDWAMLQIACPRQIRFVMAKQYYGKWYLKKILDLFGVIPISSAASKEALQAINSYLTAGDVVALFPEGRISRNGHLAAFQKGFEIAIRNSGAVIVPFYIRGLWGSIYSFASRKYRHSSAPRRTRDITVSFGAVLPETATAAEVKQAVIRLSISSWHQYAESLPPVHIAWLHMAKRLKSEVSIVNFDNTELTHTRLLGATISFARYMKKHIGNEQKIALLLPPGTGAAITNLAVLMNGGTVVNLNYTSGRENLLYAMAQAGVCTILTSKLFLQKLESKGFNMQPLFAQARVLYVEDIRASISKPTLVRTVLCARLFPAWLLRVLYFANTPLGNTAAILFSSGSEGVPKGIELTHRNIMGNIKQIAGVLNPREDDAVLSSLPVFHAFGLTVSTFMPLVEGLKVVCQPDPTDAAAIGKMVARHRATLLFGTSTFLGLYARSPRIHPLMFQSLRMVVAGAEKLHEHVRSEFHKKFGRPVYEGYGTTETTPVAGVNVPDVLSTHDWVVQTGAKAGTVGMPLPGSAFRIVDPETLAELPDGEAGLVLIAGPQLMKGYLNAPEATERALVQLDGLRWYRTGDKGRIDEDGFLTLLDRYSRFAKIGGEMVSLGAVESAVLDVPGTAAELDITSVALPAHDKGEYIVLLVAGLQDEPAVFRSKLIAAGMPPLMLPRTVIAVDAIPRLGSGKVDFAGAKRLAAELLSQPTPTV